MIDLNVTTDQMQRCLSLLKKAEGILTAAELAARMRLNGNRETQRRRVRSILKKLRDGGEWIIGFNEGCFLTDDEKVWKDYNEGRQIDAKKIIGEAAKRKKMVTDNRGQGLLFVR